MNAKTFRKHTTAHLKSKLATAKEQKLAHPMPHGRAGWEAIEVAIEAELKRRGE